MSDIINRKRSVNVEKLSNNQIDILIKDLGLKVTEMVDKTCDEANILLNIYGLQAKMTVVIQSKDNPQGD